MSLDVNLFLTILLYKIQIQNTPKLLRKLFNNATATAVVI